MLTRQQAVDLLHEHVESDNLRKHVYAVEACMIAYAQKFGEDVHLWSLAGLLHDLDYERFPEEHPMKAVEMLQDQGFSEEFLLAIQAHGDKIQTPRNTRLAKTLYAVDELASFVVACALVRPSRLGGLTVKSVKKKLKDKAFARAVNRDQVKRATEELGVELACHIETVIQALTNHEQTLNAEGSSLF